MSRPKHPPLSLSASQHRAGGAAKAAAEHVPAGFQDLRWCIVVRDGDLIWLPQRIEPDIGSPTVAVGAPLDGLLSRQQLAAVLGVSTRWVERHLRPSTQAVRRGRAWYTREDVETQLAQVPEHKRPPSRRSAAVDALTPAQRRARREAATGASAFEGVAHAKEVAVIEARLRASIEKGDRSKGRKRRGER